MNLFYSLPCPFFTLGLLIQVPVPLRLQPPFVRPLLQPRPCSLLLEAALLPGRGQQPMDASGAWICPHGAGPGPSPGYLPCSRGSARGSELLPMGLRVRLGALSLGFARSRGFQGPVLATSSLLRVLSSGGDSPFPAVQRLP